MIDAGMMAPDASVELSDGRRAALSEWRGSPFVVYFYPKDDTSGCTREALDFSALATAFADAGVKVIGVSKDPTAAHAKFTAKHALSVELGSDTDGSICDAFGVWVEKSMYGRKYMGIERATFLIDEAGRIAAVWRKVKVPGHADAVLAASRSLSSKAVESDLS